MPHHHGSPDPALSPAEAWEARYAAVGRVWSGRPNRAVADVAAHLTPGRALDLGCGEGADALWLAARGWEVTGVDLSPTAVGRAGHAAAERGLAARFVAADLGEWVPDGEFELVTAAFLQAHEALPRTRVLRRGAGAVVPGGHLLLVTHAAPPPWAGRLGHEACVGPQEEVSALDLGPAWEVALAEVRTRAATGPDGQEAELADSVVLLRRAA